MYKKKGYNFGGAYERIKGDFDRGKMMKQKEYVKELGLTKQRVSMIFKQVKKWANEK